MSEYTRHYQDFMRDLDDRFPGQALLNLTQTAHYCGVAKPERFKATVDIPHATIGRRVLYKKQDIARELAKRFTCGE